MSKRKFYITAILYWFYVLVWLVSIYYIFIYCNIKTIYKILIELLFILVTPDLPTFVQSYKSYRKNTFDPKNTDFERIRHINDSKRYDGFMISGFEESLFNIKEIISGEDQNFIIELYDKEKIIVIKRPFGEFYHRCSDEEWLEITQYLGNHKKAIK